jgi:hypothetical protein
MKAPGRSKKRRTPTTSEGWARIVQAMDETFTEYEQGLVTLRKRVVADLNSKLKGIGRLAEMTTSRGVRRS